MLLLMVVPGETRRMGMRWREWWKEEVRSRSGGGWMLMGGCLKSEDMWRSGKPRPRIRQYTYPRTHLVLLPLGVAGDGVATCAVAAEA